MINQKGKLHSFINKAFVSKNNIWEMFIHNKFHGCGKFGKTESSSKQKYSETYVCELMDFLTDNILVKFGDETFRQEVGIPMDTNCASLLNQSF